MFAFLCSDQPIETINSERKLKIVVSKFKIGLDTNVSSIFILGYQYDLPKFISHKNKLNTKKMTLKIKENKESLKSKFLNSLLKINPFVELKKVKKSNIIVNISQ